MKFMTIVDRLKVKLYSDGAKPQDIFSLSKDPKIAGFTTNPSLMKAAGIKDYEGFAREVLQEIKDKPISFEIFADELPEMKRQGLKIAQWGKNVYVKIPITNSKGEFTTPVIESLSKEGVKLNITAIFTVSQLKKAHQALDPKTPAVLSVFAGRIADAGQDAMKIMSECRQYLGPKSLAELLWASTRELYNIIQSDQTGCDIITVPPDMLKKLSTFGKDLDQFSLETVQMFKRDAEAAGFSL